MQVLLALLLPLPASMLTVVGITPLWRGINCAETRAVLLPLQGASIVINDDDNKKIIIIKRGEEEEI